MGTNFGINCGACGNEIQKYFGYVNTDAEIDA